METGALQVVPVVVANDVPLPGVVATGVDGAGVAGLEAHAMHFIVFDDVIIAAQIHGLKGGVVDEVVGYDMTDAVDAHAVLAGP